MEQIEMPLMQRLNGPAIVPASLIRRARTYREVVRLCWALRRTKGALPVDAAKHCGLVRQHVNDYLNADDKAGRRDLPGDKVDVFEEFCGNTAISQWHSMRAQLTVLEEMQAERAAA